MKIKGNKLYAKADKRTVITNKAIERIDLSFEIKCEKADFESYVRKAAQTLTECDLTNVKTLSIRFELLD